MAAQLSGPSRRLRRGLLALGTAAVALVAGCGGQNGAGGGSGSAGAATPSSSPSAAAFPVTVPGSDGPVRIAARPERIVSLSPTATETLFAIGAGRQVVAVDDQSDYPAQAPRTKLSGFTPNAEAVLGYDPDLVVASDAKLAGPLGKVKVPLLVQSAPATLEEAYAQMRALGQATGRATEGAAEAERVRAEVEKIVADVPRPEAPLKVYHELDPTFFSVTSKTFIGAVYAEFGLRNIADAADKSGSGYPQLSAEYIVSARPDVIFLADGACCGQSPQTVAKRPGWAALPAVRDGRVVVLPEDIPSRWGPRVSEFARVVGDAVAGRAG